MTAPAPSHEATRSPRNGASGRREGRSMSRVAFPRRRKLCLERASRRGGSGRVGTLVPHLSPGEVILGEKEVRLGSTLHDGKQVGHARHLLPLLLEEPVHELGPDELVLLAGEARERTDLL